MPKASSVPIRNRVRRPGHTRDRGNGVTKVLLVAATPDTGAAVAAALEGAGFAATVVSSGEDAISVLKRRRFDAAILDHDLPAVGARDLAFFVRAWCSETVPVLLGATEPETVRRRRTGVAAIGKPFRLEEFLAATRAAGRRRTARRTPAAGTREAWSPPAFADTDAQPAWAIVLMDHEPSRPQPRRLRTTLDRTALTIPEHRTIVASVAADEERLARELEGRRHPRVLLQPRDRGTAPAALLATQWIHEREPDAAVAVLSSNSVVMEPEIFMERLAEAARFVSQYGRYIVVFGARAKRPDRSHAWLACGDVIGCTDAGPVWRVERVVEAPSTETVRRGHGLWSTLAVVAQASTIVRAARDSMPGLHQQLVQVTPLLGTRHATRALTRVYRRIAPGSFFDTVLVPSRPILAVAELGGVTLGASKHAFGTDAALGVSA